MPQPQPPQPLLAPQPGAPALSLLLLFQALAMWGSYAVGRLLAKLRLRVLL